MTSWAVTKAKAQFSAVLDKAESEGPQIVERGERRFVVLTEEELARLRSPIGLDLGARSRHRVTGVGISPGPPPPVPGVMARSSCTTCSSVRVGERRRGR